MWLSRIERPQKFYRALYKALTANIFKEFEIEEGGRSQVQVLSYALILIFIYLQHNQSIIKHVGIMKYNSKLGGIEHGFHEFNEKYVE